MAIRTSLTEKFGLGCPIVAAPMGGVSGGRLAAAVSNAGASELVGGGYGGSEWMRTELSIAGEAVDLISDVAPPHELVRRIGAEAETCLRRGSDLLG